MKTVEIINASAGAGKTHNLAYRALGEIKDGLSADSLMATTFTKKAAGELAERLRRLLIADGQSEAADLLLDGFIGTVNGACSRLLSEYAIEAGLSPAMDIIPDEDAGVIFNRAVSAAIESHSPMLEAVAKRLRRQGEGNGFSKLSDWQDDVKEIAKLARSNRLGGDALAACAETSWQNYKILLGEADENVSHDRLFAVIDDALSTLEGIPEPKKGTQKVIAALREIRNDKTPRTERPWSMWAKLEKLNLSVKESAAAEESVNDAARKWLQHPLLREDLSTMIRGVFSCAAAAVGEYEKYKKEHGLMDFTDQEAWLLELLEKNPELCEALRERLSILFVDEFQDTSPIQLALFLAIDGLLGKSIWVGDPKQAIYGFRGTDPSLMNRIVDLAENTSTLGYSWRSKERLVSFANAVFKRTFHNIPRDRVCLEIPGERAESAQGGFLEAWNIAAGNKDNAPARLAIAVQSFLKNNPNMTPAQLAILCRTNKECTNIATQLEAIGIRASTAKGFLAETPPCRLALAALRYLSDGHDTLAMAEIVAQSPTHPNAGNWLEKLLIDRDACPAEWRTSAPFAELDAARPQTRFWTPLEALEFAIGSSGVLATLNTWPNSGLARSNLDKLRQSCVMYLDQCQARRAGASIVGFLDYIQESEPTEAEGTDDGAVQVLSYHKSKGLEWPVVVLYGLDATARASAFDIRTTMDEEFDPTRPLAGRRIHYWPDPIPGKQTSDELNALLAGCPEYIEAKRSESDERRRLLYVGFTRARDGLIFALRKKETAKDGASLVADWLDELVDASGEKLLRFPISNSNSALEEVHALKVGDESFDITVREFPENLIPAPNVPDKAVQYTPVIPENKPQHAPARLSPSKLSGKNNDELKATATLLHSFNVRTPVRGRPDYAHLGDAVHGFMGMDSGARDDDELRSVAARLLTRFQVEKAVTADDMLAMRRRLLDYLEELHPAARVHRECPITLRNERNQIMQGWIDMLLELDDGFIVIDHKTYPGSDVLEHALEYAPQLSAYRHAVTQATNKKILATWIHLPVSGQIVELHF